MMSNISISTPKSLTIQAGSGRVKGKSPTKTNTPTNNFEAAPTMEQYFMKMKQITDQFKITLQTSCQAEMGAMVQTNKKVTQTDQQNQALHKSYVLRHFLT